jgi:tetratricopeptide (TPR) repeat protein
LHICGILKYGQAVATPAVLRLLGTCEFEPADGPVVRIKGAKSQTMVAIAALSEDNTLSDAGVGRELAGAEDALETVRSMRSRLPDAVKREFGKGAQRWKFPRVTVDVVDLKQESLRLRRSDLPTDFDLLRKTLDQVAKPLLPDVGDEGKFRTAWLIKQRKSLFDLRVELLTMAIGLAEERPDQLSAEELRHTLAQVAPDQLPETPIVRRARWSAPRGEVSNIETPDARRLFGRRDELRLLQTRFGEGVTWQVIWGSAGIGKTELALAYATHQAGNYRVRWRVNATSSSSLRAGLRRLGRQLGIPSADDTSLMTEDTTDATQFVADLGDYLRGGFADPWLLIFDNVEHPKELGDVLRYLPVGGDVLVTTQYPDWSGTLARELQLWGLLPDDGVALIANLAGRKLPDENLGEICRLLEGNPMFLSHAAKTMSLDGIGPVEYLGRLRSDLDDAVRVWPELDVSGRHAKTTYGLVVAAASSSPRGHPGAPVLMEVLSFFASEPVTEQVLHAIVRTELVPEILDDEALTLARRALVERSLIQTYQRTQSVAVVDAVQALVRSGLPLDAAQARLRVGVEAVHLCLPDVPMDEPHGAMAQLVPHIAALVRHVKRLGDVPLRTRTADLAGHLGRFRRQQSDWEGSEAAHQTAVDLSRDDPDRRAAATRAVWLANVMRQRGHFADAEVIMGAALPTLQIDDREPDSDVAFALGAQARILRGRADSAPQEAKGYLEQAIEILERLPKVDEKRLTVTMNSHAVLLRELGNYPGAEASTRRGMEVLGLVDVEAWLEGEAKQEVDPLIAIHLRSLGNLWRVLGRFRDAIHVHDRALTIVTDLYHHDHTDRGRCLDSLGRAQRDFGDFRVALDNFTRSREISDYRFGDGNGYAGTACVNIAMTYMEMGRLNNALAAAEEAVQIFTRKYGDSWEEGAGRLRNEHTAWAIAVRAEIRGRLGEVHVAERDLREALRFRSAKYGRDPHPLVIASLESLADTIALAGRRDEALELHQKVRDARQEAIGRWSSSYWIACSEARLGELAPEASEANERLRAAEKVWSEQLAAGHPWLVKLRKALSGHSA